LASPRNSFAAAVVAAMLCATPAAFAQAPAVSVRGLEGQTIAITADTLAALPRQAVALRVHGREHVFEGVALADVLAQAGAPLGARLRGDAMSTIVIVTAQDGYAVAFSLAELDPAMRNTAALLVDRMDGAPLPPEDGPFRLAIEGDARAARSVRMVRAIRIERAQP
jgi:DMSO/TMAO reductase YedYZ molybdopterin-dependent catalytic subunit